MNVFKVTATVLGNGEVPELREERLLANSFQQALETLAEVARHTGYVITGLTIVKLDDTPFYHSSLTMNKSV